MLEIFKKAKGSYFEFSQNLLPDEYGKYPFIYMYFDSKKLIALNKKRRNKKVHELKFYMNFWVEVEYMACHCMYNPENQILHVVAFNDEAEARTVFKVEVGPDKIDQPNNLSENEHHIKQMVLFCCYLLNQNEQGKNSVFTDNRLKASLWYKPGDVVKLKRIFQAKYIPAEEYEPPEPGSSGIKKKCHEVVGHWRTYKNGKKRYIEPHWRGDPALGYVRNIFHEGHTRTTDDPTKHETPPH